MYPFRAHFSSFYTCGHSGHCNHCCGACDPLWSCVFGLLEEAHGELCSCLHAVHVLVFPSKCVCVRCVIDKQGSMIVAGEELQLLD